MKPPRVRRLLIWIAICAGVFSLPHQCADPSTLQRRTYFRNLAAIHASKAAECRRKERLARANGQKAETDRFRAAAENFEHWADIFAARGRW